MSDTAKLGLTEAASRLGVTIGVLRRAIRAGKLPAPPHLTATSHLPADWLASAQAAVDASPNVLGRNSPQKVPAFARYKGTSAWRKYRHRVRAYALFQAKAQQVNAAPSSTNS
jgi:hypothetical protein